MPTASTTHTTKLMDASTWRISHKGESSSFDPCIHSSESTEQCELLGFFDSKKLRVIYIESTKERSIAYYAARSERYWPMPTHDGTASYSDLREFVSSQPGVPAEVTDAVWSKRPFRKFKEVASADLINGWSEYEDHLDRHHLLNFFREHGVKVEAMEDMDE